MKCQWPSDLPADCAYTPCEYPDDDWRLLCLLPFLTQP